MTPFFSSDRIEDYTYKYLYSCRLSGVVEKIEVRYFLYKIVDILGFTVILPQNLKEKELKK